VSVPPIGIGAGAACDGQVLVFHDALGLDDRVAPRFVRRYAALAADAATALSRYVADVRSRSFPGPDESYHLSGDVAEVLDLYAGLSE
jgi:3-methyl-2-oxobutanoate hydroxymethyltransferase